MNNKNKFSINLDDLLSANANWNVYLMDKDGRLIDCNDKQFQMMKELQGINSRDDIIGKLVSDVLPADSAKVVLKENKQVINSGKAHQFLNVVTFKNYKTIIFVTFKTPLYQGKEVVGVFGISHYLSSYNSQTEKNKKLSKRESECLIELIKGKTANEIADKLKLSKRTIEFYISTIKSKLNCQSRSELMSKVYEVGISALLANEHTKSEPFMSGDFIPKFDLDGKDEDKS